MGYHEIFPTPLAHWVDDLDTDRFWMCDVGVGLRGSYLPP